MNEKAKTFKKSFMHMVCCTIALVCTFLHVMAKEGSIPVITREWQFIKS